MSHMIKTHHSEARASATLHHPDPSVNREENLDDAGEFSSLVDNNFGMLAYEITLLICVMSWILSPTHSMWQPLHYD